MNQKQGSGIHSIRATKRKNNEKIEDSQRDLWDIMNQANIFVIGSKKNKKAYLKK